MKTTSSHENQGGYVSERMEEFIDEATFADGLRSCHAELVPGMPTNALR